MSDKVVDFPAKKKRTLKTTDIELIGFLTVDDRDLWISDQGDVARIIAFIIRSGIKINEDTKK